MECNAGPGGSQPPRETNRRSSPNLNVTESLTFPAGADFSTLPCHKPDWRPVYAS